MRPPETPERSLPVRRTLAGDGEVAPPGPTVGSIAANTFPMCSPLDNPTLDVEADFNCCVVGLNAAKERASVGDDGG